MSDDLDRFSLITDTATVSTGPGEPPGFNSFDAPIVVSDQEIHWLPSGSAVSEAQDNVFEDPFSAFPELDDLVALTDHDFDGESKSTEVLETSPVDDLPLPIFDFDIFSSPVHPLMPALTPQVPAGPAQSLFATSDPATPANTLESPSTAHVDLVSPNADSKCRSSPDPAASIAANDGIDWSFRQIEHRPLALADFTHGCQDWTVLYGACEPLYGLLPHQDFSWHEAWTGFMVVPPPSLATTSIDSFDPVYVATEHRGLQPEILGEPVLASIPPSINVSSLPATSQSTAQTTRKRTSAEAFEDPAAEILSSKKAVHEAHLNGYSGYKEFQFVATFPTASKTTRKPNTRHGRKLSDAEKRTRKKGACLFCKYRQQKCDTPEGATMCFACLSRIGAAASEVRGVRLDVCAVRFSDLEAQLMKSLAESSQYIFSISNPNYPLVLSWSLDLVRTCPSSDEEASSLPYPWRPAETDRFVMHSEAVGAIVPQVLRFLDRLIQGRQLQATLSARNVSEALRILVCLANLALYSGGADMTGLLLFFWRLLASRLFSDWDEDCKLSAALTTEIRRLATSRHDRSAGRRAHAVVAAHLEHFLCLDETCDTLERARAFIQIFWYRLSPRRRFSTSRSDGATRCPICKCWIPEQRDYIFPYISRESLKFGDNDQCDDDDYADEAFDDECSDDEDR